MSKIICDVCGTRYPESADQCPICGRIRAGGGKTAADSIVMDNSDGSSRAKGKGGRFSKNNVQMRNQTGPVRVNSQERRQPRANNAERNMFAEPKRDRGDMVLNILLVIVIVALLIVSGYLFAEIILPRFNQPEETIPATEPTTLQTEELPTEPPTDPPIPCTELVLSETEVALTEPGQAWLINAAVYPEDTTDILTFYSSDESVATVNEEGRITAVSEGEATITISCGEVSQEYKVACLFVGLETEAPTQPLKDVTLKVDLTDITFNGRNQGYKFKVTGLDNTEVQWTSEDENIVTVDENGKAISVGGGTTKIICQYGDQKVEITIRCTF